MTSLLENLAANETVQTPAMERFIETLTALVLQYEEEVQPGPLGSPAGVLKYLMEERGLRQIDLVPILGSKSYVSQMLSGHRPIGRDAAGRFDEVFPRESAHLSLAWRFRSIRYMRSPAASFHDQTC